MGAKPKIYWRERGGGARRAYADLRDYADVGGGREALVPSGEKLATTDATTAQVLLARRLEQLDAARRGRTLHGETRHATLADFASPRNSPSTGLRSRRNAWTARSSFSAPTGTWPPSR